MPAVSVQSLAIARAVLEVASEIVWESSHGHVELVCTSRQEFLFPRRSDRPYINDEWSICVSYWARDPHPLYRNKGALHIEQFTIAGERILDVLDRVLCKFERVVKENPPAFDL